MNQTDSPDLPLDGLSLLVVEDEAIISFLLEDMLCQLGAAQVRLASNVPAALDLIDKEKPDLAVLDVNLGGERVYPVAERLDADGVPFIFTTGYGRDGIERRWQAKHVVQKPFAIETMAQTLRVILSLR